MMKMKKTLQNRLLLNLSFWSGAVCGSLTTLSGIIADAVGFNIPFSLLFPIAAFIIFGRPLWKLQSAFYDQPQKAEDETKWGRPNAEKGKSK